MISVYCRYGKLHPDNYEIKLGVENEALNNEGGEVVSKVIY